MNYEFNKIGVCINPDIEIVIDDKKNRVEIKTAEYKGKWDYGFYFHMDNGNCGAGVAPNLSGKAGRMFDTQDLAKECALKSVLKTYEYYNEFESKKNKYNEPMAILRQRIDNQVERQLSLFA